MSARDEGCWITLRTGGRLRVADTAERIAGVLRAGAPGMVGVRDADEGRWRWIRVGDVAGVEPVRPTR